VLIEIGCVHGGSAHMYMSIYVCIVFLKKLL
jgi:cephalosporin hydroxylase